MSDHVVDEQLVPVSLRRHQSRWPERSFTDTRGLVWNYRRAVHVDVHNAPELVLLPGALGNGDMGWKIIDGLGRLIRATSVTYPAGVAPECLAAGLKELLDYLGIDEISLWGSSYGAWWAQAFAAGHPHRTRALWLGNTLVDGGDVADLAQFSLGRLRSQVGNQVVADWEATLAARPESELRNLQLWMLACGLPAEAFRQRLMQVALASSLPPPVNIANVVICDCEDDPLIGPATRDQVRARYPAARHLTLPVGGHYPHVTHIDLLLPQLRQWLGI